MITMELLLAGVVKQRKQEKFVSILSLCSVILIEVPPTSDDICGTSTKNLLESIYDLVH